MAQAFYTVQIRCADGTIATHDLGQQFVMLGRSAEPPDIYIADAKASGRHAVLRFDGAAVTVRDLQSTNGTRIGGQRILDEVVLAPGMSFQVGGTHVTLVQVRTPAVDDGRTLVAPSPWFPGRSAEASVPMPRRDDREQPGPHGAAAGTPGQWPASARASAPAKAGTPAGSAAGGLGDRRAPGDGGAQGWAQGTDHRAAPGPAHGAPWNNDHGDRAPGPPQKIAPPPSAPVALNDRQQACLADVNLVPGERIEAIWEGDGYFLGTNPIARLFAALQRLVVTLTGGHIRIYLVLTDRRVMMVQSAGVFCGWQRSRSAHTIAATSIKGVGIARQTQLCCLHARQLDVQANTQSYGMIVRTLDDDGLREFLTRLSIHVVNNYEEF